MSPAPALAPSARARDAAARRLDLADETVTARFGACLAPALGPGDAVTIAGPLGAGKSALARAIIRAKLGPEAGEVPSPSYTLVNLYDSCETEIWHADLYRLSDPEELEEVGLHDAWDRALVLVEWPERLGNEMPPRRLELELSPTTAGGRMLAVRPIGPGWSPACARVEAFR
ncbi:MAG TPA: tRNA (adenosine(37)-N6)-threonylcarbamoyltransferase complex ATPase subunit type 1 TsaE [Thermohalobaculum sp.]|nr:tRNA (adenosine(37)-N6)-threonylcarbamoyltransferase complex ATPase subunit type 1 TsaE [Thermohalobaculum sp.]